MTDDVCWRAVRSIPVEVVSGDLVPREWPANRIGAIVATRIERDGEWFVHVFMRDVPASVYDLDDFRYWYRTRLYDLISNPEFAGFEKRPDGVWQLGLDVDPRQITVEIPDYVSADLI